jgi:glucose/arabinose dehydrogenase
VCLQIRSINLDGSDMKVVARGIRQIVGMDWHPVTKQLYFAENQRVWLSELRSIETIIRNMMSGEYVTLCM